MLIVTKAGGRVLEQEGSNRITRDAVNIIASHRFVFVHGGGVEVTELAERLGKPQKFVVSPKGFRSRFTDKETIDIYTMVMVGKLNSQIVTSLESFGVPAIGLSGLDGHLIQAERKKRLIILDERGRRRVIDGGYTGQISSVNDKLLHLLLDEGYVPVIAPVALSEECEPLNVDGDRSAAHIAGALNAEKLILLTDVDGLVVDGKVIHELTAFEAKDLLPKIGAGMVTKVYAAIEALNFGVGEVVISSGLIKKPITSALEHKYGTVIRSE